MPFQDLDPVDMAFDGSAAPGQSEAGGNSVLVSAQADHEGAQDWLVVGVDGRHPRLWLYEAVTLVTAAWHIREWIKGWNENPEPFVWRKTAEEILDSGHPQSSALCGMSECPSAVDAA